MAEKLFREGKITARGFNDFSSSLQFMMENRPPQTPQRPDNVTIVLDRKQLHKRGGGTVENRAALVHSICHMESYAIDLSWDILVRFAILEYLPDEFLVDWFEVAIDECRHFRMLNKRLAELDSKYYYGAFPTHGGLWESSIQTEHDVMLRLCILHMVHEARGLDRTPTNIKRLKDAKDNVSADVLTIILEEEISHVEKGVKWFKFCCTHLVNEERKQKGLECLTDIDEDLIIEYFHKMVKQNTSSGVLRPPFNVEARHKAGFTAKWYEPLANSEPMKPKHHQQTTIEEEEEEIIK
ncbi:predicted protein [Naegleria gruberi]|uniref:Predicted protein n=1 Tax=Naegleria gruberi TaxID=5762 RepID=D2VFX5_NAEGR|nr:uncharacterized protein NAEGRDRAFT_36730 [Naegleria gruberi]EFC44156.1 predicted protein [Naegleria gruberi]|eukprot:XP_002676900.1 predicted protein [Naegleria gruberi strain NEG-M]